MWAHTNMEFFKTPLQKINKFKNPGDIYTYKKKITDGSASKIYLASNKEGEDVIVKKIPKFEEWKDELNILKKITNKDNLLQLIDHYHTDRAIYIVTKFYKGFDLFEHIDLNVPYEENYAKTLIKEMALRIKDCHDIDIAHLDIKCENFMVDTMTPPKLILIDFGHAEVIKKDELKQGYSKYGTCFYLCPEGYSNFFSMASDVWSLGVCAHLILTGDYPYCGDDREYTKNVKRDIKSLSPKLSPEAAKFITACIEYNPFERPNINDVCNSNYLDISPNNLKQPEN